MGMTVLVLGLGAAAEPGGAMTELDYRLPTTTPVRDSCRSSGRDEIVVCGRRHNDGQRLTEPPPPRGMVLRRANPFDWDLGGGARMLPTITQIERPDGFIDRRIMLNVRIPF